MSFAKLLNWKHWNLKNIKMLKKRFVSKCLAYILQLSIDIAKSDLCLRLAVVSLQWIVNVSTNQYYRLLR